MKVVLNGIVLPSRLQMNVMEGYVNRDSINMNFGRYAPCTKNKKQKAKNDKNYH